MLGDANGAVMSLNAPVKLNKKHQKWQYSFTKWALYATEAYTKGNQIVTFEGKSTC